MENNLGTRIENIEQPELGQKKEELPSYLKMYEISGQDEISRHSYERYLANKEKETFVLTREKSPSLAEYAAEQMTEQSQSYRAHLIEEALRNSDVEYQKEFARRIFYVKKEDRAPLVKLGLKSTDSEVRKIVAASLPALSRNEIFPFIVEGLNDPDAGVRKSFVDIITFAPINERIGLIKKGLSDPDPEVKIASARIIDRLPERDTSVLIEEMFHEVEKGLSDPDVKVQKDSLSMIFCVEKKRRFNLLLKALNNQSPEVHKVAASLIGSLPDEVRPEMFRIMFDQGLGEELIKPALYKKVNINDTDFARREFIKTGSETTLIGGRLKDKTIIRHIDPVAFSSWQKIYESHDFWKSQGFDYVPIEPIQSYKVAKDGYIDVYSGVLDISLFDWKIDTDKYAIELDRQKDKIISALGKLKFDHGHSHDDNFCLRFFRDENGKVDFGKIPRLYLIDFDQATSPAH